MQPSQPTSSNPKPLYPTQVDEVENVGQSAKQDEMRTDADDEKGEGEKSVASITSLLQVLISVLKNANATSKEFIDLTQELAQCYERDFPHQANVIKTLINRNKNQDEANDDSDSAPMKTMISGLRQTLDRIILCKINKGKPVAALQMGEDKLNQFILRCANQIISLDLSHCDFSPTNIPLLSNLTHFKFSGYHPQNLNSYLKQLITLPNLQQIDLSGSKIFMRDFEFGSGLLSRSSSLRVVKLSLVRDKTDLLIIPNLLTNFSPLVNLTLIFDRITNQEKESLLSAIKAKVSALQLEINSFTASLD